MPAKTEAKDAAAPDKAAAPAEAGSAAGPSPVVAILRAWIPAILALALAPVGSFAVAELVLIPRLQRKLAAPTPEQVAAEAAAAAATPAGADAKAAGTGGETFEFTNVVVNLAGTMGTRYLKVSFVVTGVQPGIKEVFDGQKAKLTDVTISVLSSLTLADLEEPGAKNVLREKLVATYNQALGKRVADQVYFSDFVVQ